MKKPVLNRRCQPDPRVRHHQCGYGDRHRVTRIGSNNLLMAYVHVAHDCNLGSNIAIANTTNFAGHVTVQDNVRIVASARLISLSPSASMRFIAGAAACSKDIMHSTMAQGLGDYAVSRALNSVGLERAGYPKAEVDNLYLAVRIILKGLGPLKRPLRRSNPNVSLPRTFNTSQILSSLRQGELLDENSFSRRWRWSPRSLARAKAQDGGRGGIGRSFATCLRNRRAKWLPSWA